MNAQSTVEVISDDKIYSYYRSNLKALKKSGAFGRTAARKQEALRVTANRFGVRMGEVKSIVRELDEVHGITHEHTAAYLEDLKLMEEGRRLESTHAGVCPSCAASSEDGAHYGESVRVRLNPYELEINSKRQVMYSCLGHYLEVDLDV